MSRPDDISARPLIIGGMHRSGSSLTASVFASAGLHLGPRLLGAKPTNPLGHYEDLGVLDFHRRALAAQGIDSDGFTATERGSVPAALEPEARSLVEERMRRGVAWGWKEPRTALFLDFWQERLPDARYVFVYRRPWEVADSLFRRGDTPFVLEPTFAFDVWTHYNRLILDFVRRHADQCAVFEVSQVIGDPDHLIATAQERLGIPLKHPADRYRETLFTRDRGATRAFLVQTLAPEAWHTYVALCELAGVPAEPYARSARGMSVGRCAVLEWARASRAEAEVKQAAEREAGLRVAPPPPRPSGRRASQRLREGIAAVARRLLGRPRPDTPPGGPALLPFPGQGEAPGAQRAA